MTNTDKPVLDGGRSLDDIWRTYAPTIQRILDAHGVFLTQEQLKVVSLMCEAAALSAPTKPLPEAGREEKSAVDLLRELHAQVWGECPGLLNEDSGGDGNLDIAIRDLLHRAASPQSSVEEPLTADFAQALPGGRLDNSTYEKIEDALDKIEAPITDGAGRFLPLHERIARLATPPVDAAEVFAAWVNEGPRLAKAAGCHVGIKITEGVK